MIFTGIFVSVEPAMAGLFSRSSAAKAQYPALEALLKSGRLGDMPLGHADEIRAFYAARKGEPLWTGSSGPNQRARQFLEIIKNSWTHGLSPARYHLQEISDRMRDPDEALQAELELFLDDAAIKYAQDMSGRHLQGQALPNEISTLHPPIPSLGILRALSLSRNADKVFDALEPQSATYKRLRAAYIDLSNSGEAAYIQYLPLDFGGITRPGLRHKNIPGLRARLGAKQLTNDPLLYDDALFAAVTKFQRAEGLKDDGIIGLDTLVALNRTNRERLMQLRVNLERLRWMEGQEKPDKFVVVNIPAATLWAVQGGSVAFEMPVIVGRPERPTPALVTDIKGIRFNPDWTVPPTIKKEDILPKLMADPMYLTNKGIELTYRNEEGVLETLDPVAVDWERVTKADLNVLNMVQVAGAHNPLGRVRVLMPNSHSVYLHDTNEKEYFDKYARALSSGCIRMKEPLKIAEFVMSGDTGWSMERINSVIAQGRTSDRLIAEPIPVYILYYTVWVDDQNRVVFGRDLYGRDKILERALDRVDGVTAATGENIMANKEREKLASTGEGG